MATQLYTPGPTYIQIGTGSVPTPGSLEHLGWSERGVRITFDSAFEDVITDVSGTRIPFDVQAMGEQAFITVDLNLYDEAVLTKALNNRMGGGTAAGVAGTVGTLQVGSLMRLEAFLATGSVGGAGMHRLLVYCPYETKAAMSTLIPAFNFLAAYLDAAVEIELSSRVKVNRCIFRALPVWSQTLGGGVLWNQSTTGIAAVT